MLQQNYCKAVDSTDYIEFTKYFEYNCTRCSLSKHDNHPVIYRGNIRSKIMLIGEAPGAVEDQEGRPFSGPAGKLLDKIFHKYCRLDTNVDMLLTNCVFCRPVASTESSKQNYTPKQDQLVRCWPFVLKSIELIKPSIIIACGRTALCQLMGDSTLRIGANEGKWLSKDIGIGYQINIFTMVHPAAILHQSAWPEQQLQTKTKLKSYMEYFNETYKDRL